MNQHTPGPWHWEDWTHDRATTHVVIGPEKMGRGERPVAQLCGHANGTRKGERREPTEITDHDRANARLLAAAPDLLAALREAADMLDVAEFPEGAATVQRVRAAIAKAEGRA